MHEWFWHGEPFNFVINCRYPSCIWDHLSDVVGAGFQKTLSPLFNNWFSSMWLHAVVLWTIWNGRNKNVLLRRCTNALLIWKTFALLRVFGHKGTSSSKIIVLFILPSIFMLFVIYNLLLVPLFSWAYLRSFDWSFSFLSFL